MTDPPIKADGDRSVPGEGDKARRFGGAASGCAMLDALASLPPSEALSRLGRAEELKTRLAAMGDDIATLASGDVDVAVRRARVLVEIADASGLPSARARSRRAAARALANGGRLAESLARCEEGIAIAEAAAEEVEAARLRLASMHALAELGRLAEATAAGEAAVGSFRRLGDAALAARAAMNLGVVNVRRDRPEAALERFDAALEVLRGDPLLLGQIESNRGEAFVLMGRFDQAREAFERSLAAFRGIGATWQAAIAVGNLGDLAQRGGQLGVALEKFEEARSLFERKESQAHLARIVAEQAEAKLMVGLLDEALRDFAESTRALEATGQALEASRARASQAMALVAAGRFGEAEVSLEAAARGFVALGHTTAAARVELARAELLGLAGRGAEGEALAASAAAVLAAADRPVDAVVAARVQGELALLRGESTRAVEHAQRGLATAQALRIAPLVADLLRLRGLARRDRGELDAAIDDLSGAVAAIEGMRSLLQAERLRLGFAGRRRRVYEELISLLLEQRSPDMAARIFAVAEQARSRVLLDLLRGRVAQRVESTDPIEAELLASWESLRADLNVLYDQLSAEGDEGLRRRCVRVTRAIEEREAKLDAIETRLASRGHGAVPGSQPIEASMLAGSMAPGVVMVDYCFAGDELCAIVGDGRTLHVRRGLAERGHIEDLVVELQFQMARGLAAPRLGLAVGRRVEDARRVLGELHRLLIAPLTRHLDDAVGVLVIPSGALHLVPFAALWDGKQHLVERLPIWHAPSASVVVQLELARHRRRKVEAPRALVVAVADRAAPRIEDEAQAVSRIYGDQAAILRGEQATRAEVAAQSSMVDVLHLACHGRFSAEAPMASGLRLADGWWTLRELGHLRLGAELAVLSGCETGRGRLGDGDELVGLANTFLAGGAEAMVVSAWRVDDDCTRDFAEIFHRSRLSARAEGCPTPTASALRAAQRQLMRERPHPAFWAPFILIGLP